MQNQLILTSSQPWRALFNCEMRAIDSYKLLKYYKAEVAPSIDAVQSAQDKLIRKYGATLTGAQIDALEPFFKTQTTKKVNAKR